MNAGKHVLLYSMKCLLNLVHKSLYNNDQLATNRVIPSSEILQLILVKAMQKHHVIAVKLNEIETYLRTSPRCSLKILDKFFLFFSQYGFAGIFCCNLVAMNSNLFNV